MRALLLAALVGVVHVHHAPSHDSEAPFADVLAGAEAAGLDFVVLTEHVEPDEDGPLPAADRAGLHETAGGHRVLVLVGVELSTEAGHLLALRVPRAVRARGRSAREVIGEIHALGGFAVVAHPESHGGWRDWDAPFDGLEVQNHASDFRRYAGPLLPVHLVRYALDAEAVWRGLLSRPDAELEHFERLLVAGRRVAAFAGADAHQNFSLAGWQLDPYARVFRMVRMICPDGPLEPGVVWRALRSGRCAVRWSVHDARAPQAQRVVFPSGRSELQLDGGATVLEVSPPPP